MMSLLLGQYEVNPPIFLAPMAGITDLPFRRVVSRFKTGHFVTEMIASQEILSDVSPDPSNSAAFLLTLAK